MALWLDRSSTDFETRFAAFLTTKREVSEDVNATVREIIADVRARGDQATFPRKGAKKTGALRRGAAFVVTRGGEVLVRTRPEKGLLGGMTEVPTSDWLAGHDDKDARIQAPALKVSRWHRKTGVVTHVFTHFPLELVVYVTSVPARTRAPQDMRWVPIATLKDEALPNVMRKVIAHGLSKNSSLPS